MSAVVFAEGCHCLTRSTENRFGRGTVTTWPPTARRGAMRMGGRAGDSTHATVGRPSRRCNARAAPQRHLWATRLRAAVAHARAVCRRGRR